MSKTLSPNTRLESLKKDAKTWLKAVRAGNDVARARLLAVSPNAPAEPGLRDVQHALALEYDQESWVALKKALDDLAVSRLPRSARVDAILRHGWDGDLATARRILKRHPGLAKDSLFTAAACGEVAEVRRHLARDPNGAMKSSGSRQWTALAYVAYSRLDEVNAVEIARLLLDHGANPNFGFDDGWGCPFKVVTGAIGQGEGVKPTHAQARDLVELLIDAGADPFDSQALYNTSIVGDDPFWTDLMWRACEVQNMTGRWSAVPPEPGLGGRLELNAIDYLLGNAVGSNHLERSGWLLEHGANANAPHAYSGQRVHTLARLSGFGRMAELLERHGAIPAQLTGDEAFQAACMNGDLEGARKLSAAHPGLIANPALLLTAAMFGMAEAARIALSLGAAVGAEDTDGITPLHRAVQSGDAETVDLLLAAGGDPNRRERKWLGTALSWALVLSKPHLYDRLVPVSRDARALASLARLDRLEAVLTSELELIRQQVGEAWPTLLYCLPDDEDQAVNVASLLLRLGADPNVINDKGKGADVVARERGLDEAADLIAEARA